MVKTTSSSSSKISYEELKQKSILDFCQEDQQVDGFYTYPCEPDVWEGGKKDFITQLHEKEQKANDSAAIAIPKRHILKVLWTIEAYV